MDYLSALNDRQREAVTHGEGPVLVLAGAGSGKTRVITFRIAHLISTRGTAPHHIVAVTFTNKAAAEMRERVIQVLGEQAPAAVPLISTFHSLCVRILRRHIEQLAEGFTRDFSIYDDDDQQRVIKQCLRDLGIDERQLSPRYVSAMISHAKNHASNPAEHFEAGRASRDQRLSGVASVFPAYAKRLRASNALDFDDLLLRTVDLLKSQNDVRAYYAERFQYLLVDEYQDTNRPQFELIRLLSQRFQNLCVVGDPDQSIYRFRGADIQNIIDFETHYPTTKVITLDQNYRSTQRILKAANAVIRHNERRKEKSLRTENDLGSMVGYFQADSGDAEARFVVDLARRQISESEATRAAVLYRTNAQSRLFEEECRRAALPFNMVGGFSFYKRAEIRDILAYLKLALNLWDDESFLRIVNVPARGIGRKAIDLLIENARSREISLWEALALILAERMLSAKSLQPLGEFHSMIVALSERARAARPSETIRDAIEGTGYAQALRNKSASDLNPEESEGRLLNLEELLSAGIEAEARGESLRDFIDHAALVSDTDDYSPDARMTLMTMHSAKGLEFPIVYVVGLEEGLFPHSRTENDPDEMEEERRLCYVAITRAQQRLYLTHANYRRRHGETIESEPSRFLAEIPEDLMEDHSEERSWLSDQRRGFASSSRSSPDREGAGVHRKPRQGFSGRTYDTLDGVQEFLAGKGLKPAAGESAQRDERAAMHPRFAAGSHVRHEEYGIGTVLRREGTGDRVKLTIHFPGYGERKMIEKSAPLTKP